LSSNGEVYNDHEIVDGALHEKYREEEDFSRKDKAQSGAAFLRVFFAPLRFCVRNSFFFRRARGYLSTFPAKPVDGPICFRLPKKETSI